VATDRDFIACVHEQVVFEAKVVAFGCESTPNPNPGLPK
jgi:hypothetical protein